MLPRKSIYDSPTNRRWAVAADVAEKTLRRFLRGLNVRPACRRRIVRAAFELGIPLPTERPTATMIRTEQQIRVVGGRSVYVTTAGDPRLHLASRPTPTQEPRS